MSQRTVVVVLAVLVALSCTTAFAANIFISTSGNDTTGNGSIGSPYATLAKATSVAAPGDTIQVRAGTYTNLEYLSDIHGTPGAYITINAYDGNLTAEFTAGVYFNYFTYVAVNGLSFANSNGHAFKVCAIDVQTQRSAYIQASGCRFHDASMQVKCQQSDYITIQDSELYHVGTGGGAFDCVWVTNCRFLRNYLHDLPSIGAFVKGGSFYNVFEGNVVTAPQTGCITYGFCPGGQTAQVVANLDADYESVYSVMRNNIIAGQTWGATCTYSAAYYYVYNNLMVDSPTLTAGSDYSYVTVIEAGDDYYNESADHIYVFNNIFYNSSGNLRPYQAYAFPYSDFETGNNNYYCPGGSLLACSPLPDPTVETGATYTNPHLTLNGTPTTWQGWVDYYRPLWDSQSNAALKDHGNSNAGGVPYPAVLSDIEGNPRPRDGGWDIGPYEYQGAVAVPVANFQADLTTSTPGACRSTSPTTPRAGLPPGLGPSGTIRPRPPRTPPTPTRPTAPIRWLLRPPTLRAAIPVPRPATSLSSRSTRPSRPT